MKIFLNQDVFIIQYFENRSSSIQCLYRLKI